LAAPTSGPERIRKIGALTRGFLYYVSVTGITGARTGLPEDLKTALAQVRTLVKCPLAVGFGIYNPEQVQDLAPLVDGIVVGSAIVQKIACREDPEMIKEIGDFVAELKGPLK
jgi:tryptophan synthase alpha chain